MYVYEEKVEDKLCYKFLILNIYLKYFSLTDL